MFKNYTICEQKIRIEMPDFPNDCADWRLFETNEAVADISVACQVGEKLPEISGRFCGEQGEFSVFSDGEKVFRKRSMGNLEGALAEYDSKDGSDCRLYFTNKSFRVMTD